MYGSDQVASIEISKLCVLVKEVRKAEGAMGSGEKVVTEFEAQCAQKLRTVNTL